MKCSTAQRFSTGLILAFVTVAGCSFAFGARAELETLTCRLVRLGDCCSFTISPQHDVSVSTAIDTAAQKDLIAIVNSGAFDCIYEFDGQMKVPVRIYADDFTGTWVGGDFSLHYKMDSGARGACPLNIYYLSSGYGVPDSCKNGHAEVSRSPSETSGSNAAESGAVDQSATGANQE